MQATRTSGPPTLAAAYWSATDPTGVNGYGGLLDRGPKRRPRYSLKALLGPVREHHQDKATRSRRGGDHTEVPMTERRYGEKPSFGTRGSQVQILPLRPRLSRI
jgi:hypothetical protein